MTRTKLGLLGLCAVVVGMMAMSVASASGATLSWLILPKEGAATFLLAALTGEKDSEHLTLDGVVAGLKVAITCTNFTLNGVMLEEGGKLTNGGKVVFENCKAFEAAPLTKEYDCLVKSAGATGDTIETNEGKGELVLIGGKVETKILPKLTKKEEEEKKTDPEGVFAIIRFEQLPGNGCNLPEQAVVHGTLYVEDCQEKATTHLEKHLVTADQTNTALYLGKHSEEQLKITKVLGSAWIKLTGEHKELLWGAMDV